MARPSVVSRSYESAEKENEHSTWATAEIAFVDDLRL
jgi:hypothetical protein